jgi:hypothetical protein
MKLTLSASEFADFCLFFLLDKLQHPEEVEPPEYAEKFNAIAEIMKRRGFRSALLWYYVKANPQMRVRYRMMRNVFRPHNPSKIGHWIEIRKDDAPKDEKIGIIGRILKHIKNIITMEKQEK